MRLRVTSPLIHDGAAYEPGGTVDAARFTAEQQAHLVSCGTLLPDEEAEMPGEGAQGAGDPVDADAVGPEPAPTSSRPRKGKA
jgi:hypothetical protein